MSKINLWQKTFSIGYACACATMIRQHSNTTEVEDCFRENFMSVKTMREIGVDEYDIEVLEPLVKEIERKRALKENPELL